MTCRRWHDLLQQRLDGAGLTEPDPALTGHLRDCAECRGRFAAASLLGPALRRLAPPVPPAGLVGRLTGRLLAEARAQRRRRLVRVVVGVALAASVLVALALHFSGPGATQSPTPERPGPVVHVEPPTPQHLREQMTDAATPLVALADKAMGRTLDVLPSLHGPTMGPLPSLDTPAQALREAGQGVGAGLEPVTRSLRRGVGMLVHTLSATDPEDRSGL